MGIDPAHGSSAFGIVIRPYAYRIIQILYAEEYNMLSVVHGLMTSIYHFEES